ncbi:MAG: HNH endonuclease [Nitrososphaerota archaeon]|nr:HNH endonuclease [Nitrososphaerota archaeon]
MRAAKRRFTPEEDEYIKENSGRASLTAIARHLGRDLPSVIYRQTIYGIHKPNRRVRRFSEEEDRVIREGAGRKSMYEIAGRLGRRPTSCYGRAKRLGIDFSPALRTASRRKRHGYWWIPVMVDGRRIWRQEHRVIMEQHIGRPLRSGERVHHVNFDKGDNRIANLYLCGSSSRHCAVHNQIRGLVAGGLVGKLLELGIIDFDHVGGAYRICGTDK